MLLITGIAVFIAGVLIKIITFLGIAVLLGIILWAAKLMLSAVLDKIQEFLKRKVGGRVTVMAAKPIIDEVNKQIEQKGNVYALQQLKDQLKEDGVITAVQNQNGEIETTDDIRIMNSRDRIDPNLKRLLDENEGALIVHE
ncbi:MAG: hypothetical protein IJT73_01045 [Selenomonadaceae bacterium]|nr:hypothetical protein [Selenomonadaceae bacterium]